MPAEVKLIHIDPPYNTGKDFVSIQMTYRDILSGQLLGFNWADRWCKGQKLSIQYRSLRAISYCLA